MVVDSECSFEIGIRIVVEGKTVGSSSVNLFCIDYTLYARIESLTDIMNFINPTDQVT